MYCYKFDCYTKDSDGRTIRFSVEGEKNNREDCVAIHNALLASTNISVCGARITHID